VSYAVCPLVANCFLDSLLILLFFSLKGLLPLQVISQLQTVFISWYSHIEFAIPMCDSIVRGVPEEAIL